MEKIDVNGFGTLSMSIVTLRKPGQSYTCQEQKASLNVQNDVLSDIAFVKLDKGYYPEGNACDYSISAQTESPVGFLLELKGRKMEHAVKQLGNTLRRLRCSGVTVLYREASVVASGAQKIPTAKWQKLQQGFFNANRVRLNRYSNNGTVLFSKTIG
ncbi:MAG: hypothetical protein IJS08_08250 [Victivallales bacterium]|nr:hypothetical protein [Victivallales bacterium]